MLYNGAAARQAAHRGAPVIAVEGYVDVIAMVTAGYAATVAPLGTALTDGSARAPVEDGGRADPVLRRRRRRPPRRLSRDRPRAAAHQAGQEPAVRDAARRPRSRRPRPLRRSPARSPTCSPARDRWAKCCGAGDRGRPRRYAGAPRRPRGAASTSSRTPSATRRCAAITARTCANGCATWLRRRRAGPFGRSPVHAGPAPRAVGRSGRAGDARGRRVRPVPLGPASAGCRRVPSCAAHARRCRRARP